LSSSEVPDNPLEFIKRCCLERKILWTYHVNMRMREKHVSGSEVFEATDSFEIIEGYPDDKYLPSYLIFAITHGQVFHILFAVDSVGENVRVVTAYRPDPDECEPDLRTRKHAQ